VWDRIVWAIARKNLLKGLTCRVWPVGEFLKKRCMYSWKKFCVYFSYLPRSPPCADLHEILHEGSSSWRNQSCQILSQADQGFWFCGGRIFGFPIGKRSRLNTWLELPFSLWWKDLWNNEITCYLFDTTLTIRILSCKLCITIFSLC